MLFMTTTGVVALKEFKRGDVLLSIPEALTIRLTSPDDSPSGAGLALFQSVQKANADDTKKGLQSYIRLLPKVGGDQFATTTDFFTDEELAMLQWPPVQEETKMRVERIKSLASSSPDVSEEDLLWATWIVVSRSIAVSFKDEEGEVNTSRFLIPFLDFVNHDGSISAHQLSAKMGKDGYLLRIVAGSDVAEGEEITFAYGQGGLGSDR